MSNDRNEDDEDDDGDDDDEDERESERTYQPYFTKKPKRNYGKVRVQGTIA